MPVDTIREEQALRRLTDSLIENYAGQHSPERVRTAIGDARNRFDGTPVREFVPVLIERIARRELDGPADRGTATAHTETPASGASEITAVEIPAMDTVSARPGIVRAGSAASRRLLPAAGALALVAVVVIAVVAVATRERSDTLAASGATDLTTVRGVVGSEKASLFEDPRVAEELARHGLRVEIEPAGSRQIADMDLTGYSFAFPSSVPAAERILRGHGISTRYTPFSSPMAIATFTPIAELLTTAGVVRPGPTPTFDMARYLQLAQRNTEWTHLAGNTTYPVRKNILVSTTDPRTSNSAAMFLAIAAFVANDNAVVQGAEAQQRVLPLLSRLFTGQGYAENSSAGTFEEYLTAGMGPTPLVLIYEAQFAEAKAAGRITPDMVLTYPSPTVLSTHTVVPLDAAGDRLGRLLTDDPELQRLAAEHGFRTRDATAFAGVAAAQRLPVPAELIDVVDTPTYDTLEALLQGVIASYN
ncbi:three-helix bundle dimerization domain-containing protein [Nocardia higoensis]|uniref:three-helix bundle dimerization domain-containing protein n=1 Tax=Nocardia higoensis TaxID=228599 RepID=UPI000301C188|nr:hypothetical protein [Nocardia higoensis]